MAKTKNDKVLKVISLLDFYLYIEKIRRAQIEGNNYANNYLSHYSIFKNSYFTGVKHSKFLSPCKFTLFTIENDFLNDINNFPKETIFLILKDIKEFLSTFVPLEDFKVTFNESETFTLKYILFYNYKNNNSTKKLTESMVKVEQYLQLNKRKLYNKELASLIKISYDPETKGKVLNCIKRYGSIKRFYSINDNLYYGDTILGNILTELNNSKEYGYDIFSNIEKFKDFDIEYYFNTIYRKFDFSLSSYNGYFTVLYENWLPRLYIYLNTVTIDYITEDEQKEKKKIFDLYKEVFDTSVQYFINNKEFTSIWLNKFLNQRLNYKYLSDQSHISYIKPFTPQNGKIMCFKYIYHYLLNEINNDVDVQEKYGINDKTLTSLMFYSIK